MTMDGKMKKMVATIAVAGAISAGTAGAAFAADGATTGSGTATAQVARRHPGIRRAIRRGVVKVVVDTVGGTKQALLAALKKGETISDYATSLGKDPKAVGDALITAADTKVDQQVAANKITAARGATIKSKVPDRVNKLVTHQFGQHA
jgi:hypothetical protein